MARKRYQPKPGGRYETSAAMASMRETAFGNRAHFATQDVIDRAERMRDDDALLEAAEQKRLRKMAKRKGAGNA